MEAASARTEIQPFAYAASYLNKFVRVGRLFRALRVPVQREVKTGSRAVIRSYGVPDAGIGAHNESAPYRAIGKCNRRLSLEGELLPWSCSGHLGRRKEPTPRKTAELDR